VTGRFPRQARKALPKGKQQNGLRSGIIRDERGQMQPATKEDAQRTSGDLRPRRADGRLKKLRGES
jgi:hypothetical protein